MRIIIDKRKVLAGAAVLVTVASITATVFGVTGCGEKKAEGKIKVAASIVPLADLCRNVGGDLVEVETMVPPGASPHTFEPTSEQMMFLSDASVFVYNGLDLETWITDIVKKVGNKELVEVAASDKIPRSDLIEVAGGHEQPGEEGHEESGDHENEADAEHDHGVYDPHVWLDPNLAVYEVVAIRDGLIKADPGNEGTYKKNADEYIKELKELDKYVKGETSAFTKKKFVSFHPAFTYFAHRYGLDQVGTIEELPGKEPGAGEIAKLVDEIKKQGVQVIFTEPQFNPQAAETIATESGAEVVLKSLDPLGDPENPETATYIMLIKHDTGVMAEAMK